MSDTFLQIYILVVMGIFGAVFGSFINCMAWRIAHGESVLHGRSHCALCGHTLGILDLIPILSFLALRGKCRYCGEKISPRYMLTEILLAAAFVVTAWNFGVTFLTLRYALLACVLLGLSLVDLEIYEIPDRFIVAGIVIWAATVPLIEVPWAAQVKEGLLGGFALGGALLILSLIFDKVTGKESLGGGDVKLFFMTGLFLGPWAGLLSVIVSCIIGIVFVIAMGQKKIPFGPAISLSAFICCMWGSGIVNWYLSLF